MNDVTQGNRKMKAIVFILFVISVLAGLCAVTGANILGSLNGGNAHSLLNRMAAAAIALYCGGAAYACVKRKLAGWWMVTVLWMLVLASVLVGGIWTAIHIDLPLLGLVLGGLGELVKIVIGGMILWRVWLPLRKDFPPRAHPSNQ